VSWEQLLSIAQEWREMRQENEQIPVACPNDGEPLRAGPRGELYCLFDGWEYRA
jgi:hypothetical protein